MTEGFLNGIILILAMPRVETKKLEQPSELSSHFLSHTPH
jgi:hypothetical protein